MRTEDFDYTLPEELIAQQPLARRSDSRMLIVEPAKVTDSRVRDLADQIQSNDLLVFNDTRVMPARLYGEKKETGGRVEILIERITTNTDAKGMVKASKSPPPGTIIRVANADVVVGKRDGVFFELHSTTQPWLDLLHHHGEIPLPPYITRAAGENDLERYQSVMAQKEGAVAAPTASLHFDDLLIQRIQQRGARIGKLTLHVGAGTFQPVRVNDIEKHQMHSELFEVGENLVNQVRQTQEEGGRVIAIGTTVVRALESASTSGELQAMQGDSQLFITPGYPFHVVDALLTNFHLPRSTLLMLVSAFAGTDAIRRAYQHAIEQRYRFFSYGDAMWIPGRANLKNPT